MIGGVFLSRVVVDNVVGRVMSWELMRFFPIPGQLMISVRGDEVMTLIFWSVQWSLGHVLYFDHGCEALEGKVREVFR